MHFTGYAVQERHGTPPFADTLRDLGFSPSKADPDVWMRNAGDCYEYIAVYTDDLLVAMKDPATFVAILESDPYNYKLKGDRNNAPKTPPWWFLFS